MILFGISYIWYGLTTRQGISKNFIFYKKIDVFFKTSNYAGLDSLIRGDGDLDFRYKVYEFVVRRSFLKAMR